MTNEEKFILVGLLVITLILVVLTIYSLITDKTKEFKVVQNQFQTFTSSENNVEFQVTPLSSSEFEISISTHSVDLGFDLAEISTLYDDLGTTYKPLKWEGSEPGGHHRSGVLKFSAIDDNAKSIKLVIVDSARREFSWNLR